MTKPNTSTLPRDELPTRDQLDSLSEKELLAWIEWLESQDYSETLNDILIVIQAVRIDRGDFKPFQIG